MRFYQVSLFHEGGTSAGFRYFTDKRLAQKEISNWKAMTDSNEDYLELDANITIVEIKPTRKGIRAALNRYASHADNG